MAISASEFAANVSGELSITVYDRLGNSVNLNIHKLNDQHPAEFNRNFPLLYPANKFQTGLATVRLSVGSDPFRQENWTAHYFYAHAEAGTGRYAQSHDDLIAQNCKLITDAFLSNLASLGVEDIEVANVEDPGLVFLPDGKQAYGAGIDFTVIDYRNL